MRGAWRFSPVVSMALIRSYCGVLRLALRACLASVVIPLYIPKDDLSRGFLKKIKKIFGEKVSYKMGIRDLSPEAEKCDN